MNLAFIRTLGMQQEFNNSLVSSMENFIAKSWVWGVDVYEKGKLHVLLTVVPEKNGLLLGALYFQIYWYYLESRLWVTVILNCLGQEDLDI